MSDLTNRPSDTGSRRRPGKHRGPAPAGAEQGPRSTTAKPPSRPPTWSRKTTSTSRSTTSPASCLDDSDSQADATGAAEVSVEEVLDIDAGEDVEVEPAALAAPPSRVAPAPSRRTISTRTGPCGPRTCPGGDWSAPAVVDPLQVQEDLRAEAEQAAGDPARVSRLLAEVGESEERFGNEAGAARDYLAAFNARPEFREPLEALLRVLDRRRSLKNLQKLTRRARPRGDDPRRTGPRAGGPGGAPGRSRRRCGGSAHRADRGARAAGRRRRRWRSWRRRGSRSRWWPGGSGTRRRARGRWRRGRPTPGTRCGAPLLQIDATMLAARRRRRRRSSSTTRSRGWRRPSRRRDRPRTAVAIALEQAANHGGRAEVTPVDTDDKRLRVRAYATALDVQAELIFASLSETAQGNSGDASGVPRTDRTPTHMVDAWLRAADAHARSGDAETAAARLDRALEVVASTGANPAEPVEPALLRTPDPAGRSRGRHAEGPPSWPSSGCTTRRIRSWRRRWRPASPRRRWSPVTWRARRTR